MRNPLYRLYEEHLRRGLAGRPRPRHVGVVCDGNRRWARENGFEDISHGHRMGARKIAEMLGWCDAAGIEMATIYLLSTENLNRDPGRRRVVGRGRRALRPAAQLARVHRGGARGAAA